MKNPVMNNWDNHCKNSMKKIQSILEMEGGMIITLRQMLLYIQEN